MYNILLVCSAGMSTSMLVKKMQDAAAEKGVEATIWAVGDAESVEEVKKADIVLLGTTGTLSGKENERTCKP